MKELFSKNNPIFKHLTKLCASASYRYAQKHVVITGDILIKEISSILPIKTLLTNQEVFLKAEKTYLVDKQILKSVSGLASIQGPIAEVPLPPFVDLCKKSKIVILDNISDPGNMGTIIRSALAFGIDGIHITKGSCDPFNDKVIRSSKGALFKIPISYEPYTPLDISRFDLLLAHMDGENSHELMLPKKPIALVLSNETRGLDPKWTGKKVAIKMFNTMESLNVAVAGSILFYELAKHSFLRDNSTHNE